MTHLAAVVVMQLLLGVSGPAEVAAELPGLVAGLVARPVQVVHAAGVTPDPLLRAGVGPAQTHPHALGSAELCHHVLDELLGPEVDGGEPRAPVHQPAVVVRRVPGALLGRDQETRVLVETPAVGTLSVADGSRRAARAVDADVHLVGFHSGGGDAAGRRRADGSGGGGAHHTDRQVPPLHAAAVLTHALPSHGTSRRS